MQALQTIKAEGRDRVAYRRELGPIEMRINIIRYYLNIRGNIVILSFTKDSHLFDFNAK